MARVFVSYADEDVVAAGEVYRWLDDEHHDVFLAANLRVGISAGEVWRSRLYERLRWADAVVCVVTSASVASTWCTAEVSSALMWGARLIPILAERGVVHPLLSEIQHIKLAENQGDAPLAFTEALRRVDAGGGWGWQDDRAPFVGLRPLDVEDHRAFFGRTAEVEQLAGVLRSPLERAEGAMLLVVGPSGCGKSSLVRAGLLHVMGGEPGWWTLPPILPGTDPVAELSKELAASAKKLGLGWTLAEVAHRVADGDLKGLAGELLLAAGERRLLVVVDQFEEVFTQAPAAARAHFARLLHPVLGGPVQVVATLRPEFLDQLLGDAALQGVSTRLYPLRPLRRDALRMVIEGPARLANIGVDAELVARIVADTGNGDALPLLAFTLAQLSEGITRGGQLSSRRYEQIGGVQGALTSQANAALAEACSASGQGPEQVIAGLLRLVTVDEQGRPTRWRVPHDELPAPVARELDTFIRRRLLTTDTDQGRVVVGVAHEAFLSAWAPLAHAIQDNAVALRASRTVEQAATEWDQEDRPQARLWERGQLASALADTGTQRRAGELVSDRVELSPPARAFLQASIRRDRFRRGRAFTVLSVLLALALTAAGYAFTQQHIAVAQRDLAVSRQAAEQALTLRTANPALATQLALAAYRLAPNMETRSSLLSATADPQPTRLTGHTARVRSVVSSPDGRTLATASEDNTAKLWDLSDSRHPGLLATLTGHTSDVLSVGFSPDGRTLATASDDGTAKLWDLSDSRHPGLLATLTGHTSDVNSVGFSPDGRTLATASGDATARLWDISDSHQPHPLATLTGHTSAVLSVGFSPDGRTLATGSNDNTAKLWDLSDSRHPDLLATLTGHTGTVFSVGLSPDGRTLATGSNDGTAKVWDLSDSRHPGLLATLTGHTSDVLSVGFSPDGRTLATGSNDNTAKLWDLSDSRHPGLLATLTGHTSTVWSVSFSPDGRTLATASGDNTTRLWELPGPILGSYYSSVLSVGFSADGRTLATGSTDGTAKVWDLSDSRHPGLLATLTGHTSTVWSVSFSPDGRTLATGSNDGTAKVWDLSNLRHPGLLATLTGHTSDVNSVGFSPDGRTLATGSDDGTVKVWDLSDLHHPGLAATLTSSHPSFIHSVGFSRDGRTLATGSTDGTAKVWDLSNLHHPGLAATLTGHTSDVYSVGFSRDGRTLATGSTDGTAKVWDLSNLHNPSLLATLTGHTGTVFSVGFSPNGRTLASGSDDGTVKVWDLSDLRHPGLLATLTGHTGTVFSVGFSPDGHTLATGSRDRTARLWETNLDNAAVRICATAWPTISTNEWNQYLPGPTYQPPCP